MNAKIKFHTFLLTVFLVSLCSSVSVLAQIGITNEPQKIYYGIEVNDVLCGYFESIETPIEIDGNLMIEGNTNIFIMLSLLGSEFNTELKIYALLDPETRKCPKFSTKITQAAVERTIEATIQNNIATIISSQKTEPTVIKMEEDVLFGQDEMFYFIKKDFYENGADEVSYKILQPMEEEVQTSILKKVGTETLELVGKSFETIIIEESNQSSGLKTKYWLDPDEDYFIKFEVLNRKIYLADQYVVDKIKVANMDASLITKTNKSISDIQSISYMKLNVHIEPTGVKLTPEDLNIPGQKFTGTVKDNVVKGIMEIEHPRYDGKKAPPFPSVYSLDESMNKYLEAENMIQSDDPVLVKKAEELTAGAKDSWDAATKITTWVAENISYAIPGGGNARKTYDIRAGECGAHSMLVTAFCRAVGIPSRVVWGAMYVPNQGGAFGQHGWNEIYMGDAGWITIDATAFENDFVDAGHIRIAELQSSATSFNGKEIEILDYKLISNESTEDMSNLISQYLGKYTIVEAGRTFTVLEEDGGLALDIPGQMVLPFKDADDLGRWYCKLTNNLYLEFNRKDEKDLYIMRLHEMISMTKKAPPAELNDGVPSDFRPYLGTYFFAAANKEFQVLYLDSVLAVNRPDKKEPVKLQQPNENGGWLDEFNKNTIYFEKDNSGQVTMMKIDTANDFIFGEMGVPIVEETIDSLGIEEGIKKYRELENTEPDMYIFTEAGINRLGYKYVEEGKLDVAIEIMKLNIEAYPEAWNTYDSMGDVYARNGQIDLAIPNFKKSLELNPENTHAESFLKQPHTTNLLSFDSDKFTLRAELKLPALDKKTYPLVIMVHGDGNGFIRYHNKLKYSFHAAGYATLIWDKPGNGGSSGLLSDDNLLEERSSILLKAIEEMKKHPKINPESIGLWGISQASYVIPKVLGKTNDIKFVILTGAAGENGINQTAYFVSRQILCEGFSEEEAEEARELVVQVSSAKTYEDYKKYGQILLEKYPIVKKLDYMAGILPEDKWKAKETESLSYFNPIDVIQKTTIPTLVFLGELDKNVNPIQAKEAYNTALKKAGNSHYTVEFIPGADHDIILCDTGCQSERNNRSVAEWNNYAPEYLIKMEEWLTTLK